MSIQPWLMSIAEIGGVKVPKYGIQVSAEDVVEMQQSDHSLDAFVAALVARAVERGAVVPIPYECMERASVEGWIRLPTNDALRQLA